MINKWNKLSFFNKRNQTGSARIGSSILIIGSNGIGLIGLIGVLIGIGSIGIGIIGSILIGGGLIIGMIGFTSSSLQRSIFLTPSNFSLILLILIKHFDFV